MAVDWRVFGVTARSRFTCWRLETDVSFRSWRERMLLSQERIAEMSGLSVRTVQRLEAGHRVSYASLRALATAFKTDVDLLERDSTP